MFENHGICWMSTSVPGDHGDRIIQLVKGSYWYWVTRDPRTMEVEISESFSPPRGITHSFCLKESWVHMWRLLLNRFSPPKQLLLYFHNHSLDSVKYIACGLFKRNPLQGHPTPLQGHPILGRVMDPRGDFTNQRGWFTHQLEFHCCDCMLPKIPVGTSLFSKGRFWNLSFPGSQKTDDRS